MYFLPEDEIGAYALRADGSKEYLLVPHPGHLHGLARPGRPLRWPGTLFPQGRKVVSSQLISKGLPQMQMRQPLRLQGE